MAAAADCLRDSGAIGGSFIGKETLRSLRSCVLSTKPAEADEATLADKQTQLKLEGKALLKVQLPNSKGEWTTGYVWFYVIDKPLKMIIGLHDLQDKLVEVFIDLTDSTRSTPSSVADIAASSMLCAVVSLRPAHPSQK